MPIPKPLVKIISDNEAPGAVKEFFEVMRQKQGKVPEWMRVMAHCDDTLMAFFGFFKTLMDDAPADPKLKWKLGFRVSELNKCEYCVSVTKGMLKKLGISDEDLQDIEKGMSEKERLALKFAGEMTEHAYNISDDTLAKMKENFSDAEIVEIASVVGLFNYINRFNDALGVLITED
ncbi:carboxymuconolactone decarboxylase family protein [Patescibacteria group bacterium]|nr:carboxymuconolactone decarboxylase family protein [Patescibacteria group bacterium]MBU1922277.1 carboxymuconolactone decarboxylase family protein [Patescibacteria group bacterium]